MLYSLKNAKMRIILLNLLWRKISRRCLEHLSHQKTGLSFYLPKTLRIKPKRPSNQLKLISNFSSTETETSKISLLIAVMLI